MIPYFALPSLHLFTLPSGRSVDIHAFGLLVATAIFVGLRMQKWRGRQLGLDGAALSSLAEHVIIAGFLFSHLFEVVAYDFAHFVRDPAILFESFDMSSMGGLLGAVLGLLLWRRRHAVPMLPYVDATVFGFVFAWVFGRLGCFTAHDHPGRHTHFPLALAGFPPLYPGDPSLPRHDLGLYEALFALALSASFALAWRARRRPGWYVAVACLAYAPVRFGLDFLRFTSDEIPPAVALRLAQAGHAVAADVRYLGLTPAQYASIAILLVGVAIHVTLRRRRRECRGARP